jgi:hypothetical protein
LHELHELGAIVSLSRVNVANLETLTAGERRAAKETSLAVPDLEMLEELAGGVATNGEAAEVTNGERVEPPGAAGEHGADAVDELGQIPGAPRWSSHGCRPVVAFSTTTDQKRVFHM